LPLGNDLGLTILGDKYWKLLQMNPDEIPNAFFSSGFELETFLKASVGFIGRNYEILLYSASPIEILIHGTLFLV